MTVNAIRRRNNQRGLTAGADLPPPMSLRNLKGSVVLEVPQEDVVQLMMSNIEDIDGLSGGNSESMQDLYQAIRRRSTQRGSTVGADLASGLSSGNRNGSVVLDVPQEHIAQLMMSNIEDMEDLSWRNSESMQDFYQARRISQLGAFATRTQRKSNLSAIMEKATDRDESISEATNRDDLEEGSQSAAQDEDGSFMSEYGEYMIERV